MRYAALAMIILVAVSVVFAADVADRQLEMAKHVHDLAVARADAELQRAQQKCEKEKAEAKARLVKAYEDAITRATRHGDLEAANKLLAEKKSLEAGGDASATADADAGNNAAPKVTWVPLDKDGIPPGLVIADIEGGAIESDYLRFFEKPDLSGDFHGHRVQVVHANHEGVFQGPGPKNIEINYYGFYIHTDVAQRCVLSLRTTKFSSIKLFLDGRQILEHGADKNNPFETRLPLNLTRGDHAIVIYHRNDWEGNWIGVQIEGHRLLTTDFSQVQKAAAGGNK